MEEEIREKFLNRLHTELKLFKETMFRQEKDVIFGESYKIEIFVNVYEILVEKTEILPVSVLQQLLHQSHDILEFLYQQWLKKDDNSYIELSQYVDSELKTGKVLNMEAVYGE